MKIIAFILFSVLCSVLSNSGPITLTDANWPTLIETSKRPWLVAFKAEWCGHCQRLKPELEKAAQIVNEADGLVFATVDINDNPALKEKYGVQGLPTMLLMRPAMEGGLVDTTPENVVEFREGRTATALVALSNRLKHPSVMKFSNANDLIKWVNIPTHHPVKYVLVRNSVEDVSELATSFYNLAKRMQHKLYFGESNPEVISTAYPSLLKKIEEKYTPLIVRIERGVPHYELVTRELLMELSYFEQSLANIKASRFFSALVPKATLNGPELDVVLFTWIVHTHWETYSMLHSQNFYMMSQNPENRYLVIAAVDTNDVEAAAIDSPDKRMSSSYRLHSAVATLSNPSLSNFPSVIRDKFLFGYLDAKHYEEFLEQFGITPDQYPTLLVLDAANSAYWTDATVDEVEEMETWLLEIYTGTAPMQKQGVMAVPQSLINKFGIAPTLALGFALVSLVAYTIWKLVIAEALGYNAKNKNKRRRNLRRFVSFVGRRPKKAE